MSKDTSKIWELLESMSDDELGTLGEIVNGINRLELMDGVARYSDDEIDVIGRFQDLDDLPEDEDDQEPDEEPGDEEMPTSTDDANTASYAQMLQAQQPIAEDNTENPRDDMQHPLGSVPHGELHIEN